MKVLITLVAIGTCIAWTVSARLKVAVASQAAVHATDIYAFKIRLPLVVPDRQLAAVWPKRTHH